MSERKATEEKVKMCILEKKEEYLKSHYAWKGECLSPKGKLVKKRSKWF